MLAYLEWKRLYSSYYRSALDYFYSNIQKENDDIALIDIEFKINEVIISYENLETGFGYYKSIKIEDFLNFHYDNLNKQ